MMGGRQGQSIKPGIKKILKNILKTMMNPREYSKTELKTELICTGNSAPSIEECSKVG